MFWRIAIGVFMMLVGLIMIWKTEAWLRMFGRVPFAEKYIPTEGGSRLFYKLLGMLVVLIGLFVATNLIQDTLESVFLPLFSTLA